ncbi:hypothetical protein [Crenobacter cavernae]|uniref:Uncharacterized protein n=1 Tax=Crenobacter cavernae TaxID=2290923 RepID=A0A345Y2M8_9NEIS|nr:hypothetical protein [Crenobacter cavernae]AXK38180.1 hypothetical protein DWG20_01330 [Crenobacter cavernae]
MIESLLVPGSGPAAFAPSERSPLKVGFMRLTDCAPLVRRVNRFDVYADVADALGIPLPASPWRLAGGPP